MHASWGFLRRGTLALAILSSMLGTATFSPRAAAQLLITEVNSNGSGGDFFELYNYGASTIDLGGYLWSDNALPIYTGSNTYTLGSFSLAPSAAVVVVADSGQNGAGNAAFLTNWGTTGPPVNMGSFSGPVAPFGNPALTGRGLGQNDSVVIWDAAGNFVTGLNYGTTNLTVTTVSGSSILAPFNRVVPPGGSSAGGHAGVAGGGVASVSLIWDPTSPVLAPLYTSATSVGLYGSFANATSAATIGSPGLVGIVPEPSGLVLAGLGVAAAGCMVRRRMRGGRTPTS